MPKSKSSVGQMLLKSLTSEQISNLLTVVSASMDLNTYMEKFEKIDPDMATTVKRFWPQKKIQQAEAEPSDWPPFNETWSSGTHYGATGMIS